MSDELEADREAGRDALLLATLPHVAFDGWSDRSIKQGAVDADVPTQEALLMFPGGAAEMIEHWSRWSDRQMSDGMRAREAEGLRMRDRIGTAIRLRLEANAPWREAVRRTVSWLALPINTPLALRATWGTANSIWYACGDVSTDLGWYTKRASLAAVYSAAVLYWLEDVSENSEGTWAFVDRRIDDVTRLPGTSGRLSDMVASMVAFGRRSSRKGRP